MAKLSDKLKTALATVIVAGAIVSQSTPDSVKVCDTNSKQCQTLTAAEYDALKTELADKIKVDTPLTFDEYQELVAALDHELKGGRDLGPIKSQQDLKQKLTDILYE